MSLPASPDMGDSDPRAPPHDPEEFQDPLQRVVGVIQGVPRQMSSSTYVRFPKIIMQTSS